MNRLAAVALAAAVMAVGFARADDAKDDTKEYPKLLLGKWEITKAGNPDGAEAGTTLEFLKEGKLKAVIKEGEKKIALDGTYTLDKNKLTGKLKVPGKELVEVSIIKKLTDEALELEDTEGRVDVLKKVKEKKDDKKDEK